MKKEICYLDGQVSRYQTNAKFSQFLLELGGQVCLLTYWDSCILNQSLSFEQSSKRQKRTEKLEGLMELVTIEHGKFSWRW